MNRFLKKICTGILCGVLGVVSIGAQEAFAADAKEMRAVWISTVYSADYPSKRIMQKRRRMNLFRSWSRRRRWD